MKMKEQWWRNEDPGFDGGGDGGGGGESHESSAPAAAPAFDAEKFSQTFASEFAKTVTPVLAPKKEMSVEDFRAQTKYYAVSDQDIVELYGDPQGETNEEKRQWIERRKAAQQRIIDGAATHANTVAGLLSNFAASDLKKQFEPLVAESKERQFNSYVSSIVDGHEVFKDMKGSKDLIKTAIGMLQQGGYQPQGAEKDKAAILAQAEKIVQMAGGQLQASNASAANNGAGRAAGMASGVNSGGAGGAANASGKGKNQQPWQKLPF